MTRLALAVLLAATVATAADRPHVVVFLADDLMCPQPGGAAHRARPDAERGDAEPRSPEGGPEELAGRLKAMSKDLDERMTANGDDGLKTETALPDPQPKK